MDNNKFGNFQVVTDVLPKVLTEFLYSSLLLSRETFALKHRYYGEEASCGETWGDSTCANSYAAYGAVNAETLLANIKPHIEVITGLSLVETYSYSRVYENGQDLIRHSDRSSCEISVTANLGGEPWAIYLDDNGETREAILDPGDILVYRGVDAEHWREPYKGKTPYGQVFLHYNDVNGPYGWSNKLDRRVGLGVLQELEVGSEKVKQGDADFAVKQYMHSL